MGAIESVKIEQVIKQMAGKKVYFDTNPIVYFTNKVGGFFDVCLPIFQSLDREEFIAYSSEIALSELLVKPMREGNLLEVRQLKNLFEEDGFFILLSHDREIFELTANIRALKNLKMIDAVHVATALVNGCDFLITGDNKMAQRITGIDIVNLNDYVSL
jgi:predicted nucleic acid-binding protein